MNNTKNLHKESAVVDNNILQDLFELGKLDILFAIFRTISIPKAIYDSEVPESIKTVLQKHGFVLSNLETEIGYNLYNNLSVEHEFRNLSHFDKLAISIAKESMYYCNSNDNLVKKACSKFEVNYIGILGVLKIACENELMSKEELTNLAYDLASERTSCYMSKKVVDAFINNL